MTKERNWFAKKHHLVGRTTILYSGNMGYTHDIETIVKVAEKLKTEKELHFLFIGDGKKCGPAKKFSIEKGLTNITFLPLQSEKTFPCSIASGDIGMVSYQPGTEGCMLPSKAYYYMAAGVVPFVLCTHETDLMQMVLDRKCGVWMKNEDIEKIADMLLNLHHNSVMLEKLKHRARQTAVELYSKKNIDHYVDALEKTMLTTKRHKRRKRGKK